MLAELKKTINRVIYVEINPNSYLNGYLCLNSDDRKCILGTFSLEKYNAKPLAMIPGTLKGVHITQEQNKTDNYPIFRIVLGDNFEIIELSCINRQNYAIEKFLTTEIKEQKISGIYPGYYSNYQDIIGNLSEMQMAQLVKNALSQLNYSKEKSATDTTEWQFALEYCLAHLSQFGVEQKFNPAMEKMEITNSFKLWYQKWAMFFESQTEDSLSGISAGCYQNCEKEITTINEAQFYLLVDQAINRIKYLEENKNPVCLQEIKRWRSGFEYLLAQSTRFGVQSYYNIQTKKTEPTASFYDWYNWWNDYFKEINQDPNSRHAFETCRRTCDDLSKFHPAGNFNDYQKRHTKCLELNLSSRI